MPKRGSQGQPYLQELVEELKKEVEVGEKRGAFGIEARASERAREVERAMIEAEIREHDRGYEGNTRRCPRCGKQTQRYKGDEPRIVEFECGEIGISRSHYVCEECRESSYPLDEKLGLVSGKEQGRLRKKLSMLAVIAPYHQAPTVCETMFGSQRHATNLRRVLLREAKSFEESSATERELPSAAEQTVYLQIDGHMCPTREERKNAEDQGFREAKAVLAYRASDVVEVSEKRRELLQRILKAKVTTSEDFLPIVRKVYQQSHGDKAELVVVLGDGAKWIWNIVEEVAPEAIQVLDFSHAKQYLYEFANIRFRHEPQRVKPWVDEQIDRLCTDRVQEVIGEMKPYADLDETLARVVSYFANNAERMRYGTYRSKGLTIGSGAIESAGKQLSVSRIKGAGMRWNVGDLNPMLAMRAAFLDGAWVHYWKEQEMLAA